MEKREPEIRYVEKIVYRDREVPAPIIESPKSPKNEIVTKVEQEYEEEFEVIERVAVDVSEKKYDLTNEKN